MKPNRKFPYLSKFLEQASAEADRELLRSVPPNAWVTGLAVSVVALTIIGGFFGAWLVGAGVAVVGTAMSLTALTAQSRQRKLLSDPTEQRRREVYKTLKEFRALENERKLHRWMDPIALHLLEAGAYSFARIQTTLSGPQWSPRDLPAYWVQIKQQVQTAATEGMADLVLLARNCVGPPQKDRQNDIKGIVESFVDLDLADALQGMKQMASADWTAYAHQSPQSEAVARHGRLIAERLRDLADDVDAKSSEIAVSSSTMGGFQSLEALDGALEELRSVRQAESEIQQRLNG